MTVADTRDWLVRPVRNEDVDAVYDLAAGLGPGMTTLPADRDALAEKIERSVASFGEAVPLLSSHYLLVLEELGTGAILGTAALYPNIGTPHGFFSYKRIRLVHRSQALAAGSDVELLMLANDYTGTTEIGTLAVRPQLKGTGAGRLLSRSRFMLVATRPELFSPVLMAEMRGWQDAQGTSPFWDAVGAHFFKMDFATADHVSAMRGADFIAELLPKHPVYIDLLPEGAREVIGRPHDSSAPAMAMLLREGFRYEGYVDVFDAGPQVHAARDQIDTVRQSRLGGAREISPALAPGAPSCLVCADDVAGFRAIATRAYLSDGELALDDRARRALGASRGQSLRWSPSPAAAATAPQRLSA